MHARRGVLPTSLSSADLQRWDADILRASFFSAKTTLRGLLEQYKADLTEIIAPRQVRRADRVTPENPEGWVTEGMDQATSRLRAKQLLQRLGYEPDEAKRGTIQDLSSDARINLVVETNAAMAQNYGWFQQAQDPDLLDAFPAQELYRGEDRQEPRMWIQRWRAAGGTIYPGRSPGLPIERSFTEGRLIARKDDPIWTRISRFGNPYPPFDFNSGVDVRDIGYQEAVDLGVIRPGERVMPTRVAFGQNLGQELATND